MKPTVSVLICTFGEESWRALATTRALPSATQQGAVEVVAYHSPDGTLADCRNAAGAAASGDYLCFLDADDELAPGYIAAMREAAAQRAQRGDTPFSSPGVMDKTSGKLVDPPTRATTEALFYPAVQYCRHGHWDEPALLGRGLPLIDLNRAVIGTLVPRQLFLDLNGFGEEPIYEDWALWLRCSEYVPLVPVEEAVYRVNVKARTRNENPKLGREWYDRIRERHGVRRGD